MLKRLSLYTLLLCLAPIFTWIFPWHWHGDLEPTQFDYALYWLTETGSVPYAAITCVVFALLYFLMIQNKKQGILVIVLMAVSVISMQVIKEGMKALFAEPRPFVTELAEKSGISTEMFYAEERDQRKEIVLNYYKDKPQIPDWIVKHHSDETGYSFPSGHSIFAAGWLMLAVGFGKLLAYQQPRLSLLTGVITLWAILMLISRLRLGMHYPIDVLISTLIAWLFHLIFFTVLQNRRIFTNRLSYPPFNSRY